MVFFKSFFLLKGILLILIFITITTQNFADFNNVENYGPYTIDITKFDSCAGPKSKNCTYYNVELTKLNEIYVMNMNLTVLTQCHIDEVKIKAYQVEKDQKKLLFNYKVDDPCHHFAFSVIIQKYFEANQCMAIKGTYYFKLNLNDLANLFYGNSSFYGTFRTKSVMTSKQGNIGCWVIDTVFNKRI